MRILFLNKASPKHEGGAEIRTREVGKRLVASGHEVVVLAAKTNLSEAPFEVVDGMKLHHKKVLPDWFIRRFPAPHYFPLAAASLFLMVHLYFFLKKEKFDAIREDISPFPPSFLLAFARLPAGKRIAVVHNLPGTLKGWLRYYGPVYGAFGFLFDRLLRGGWLKYDRIVCAAKWLADDLSRSPKIAGRVRYVPNGIDPDLFLKAKTGRADVEETRLLSVGRLVENKGYRHLIEALSYLKRDSPQLKLRLTLLGKGPLKDLLIRLAVRLKIDDRLEICSPVPYGDMPQVYDRFDLLVFPSLSEGFPMTVLEAMAARLPIVASDIPGVREIVDEDSATLFSSQNAPDLVEKLRWALEHPEEIGRKAESAYQKVKRYHWETIAREEL